MTKPVKRRYESPVRAEQAERTRHAVLRAARELFIQRGYAATSVAAIAQRAGVAVDTIYAAVGRKPEVYRLLVETALSGTDEVVPAEQRDYVAAIRAAATASDKLRTYAAAVVELQPRLAPLYRAWRGAAGADPDLAGVWHHVARRRAANMRFFAQDLAATGELRSELSIDTVADIVWSMNGPEYWLLLVEDRGWSPSRFQAWLLDAWQRLLLASPGQDRGNAPELTDDHPGTHG